VLELEELHESHLLTRRREVAQTAGRVGQHDAGLVDVEQLHTPHRQPVQELDDVVVSDEGVCDLDERAQHFTLVSPRLLTFCISVQGPSPYAPTDAHCRAPLLHRSGTRPKTLPNDRSHR